MSNILIFLLFYTPLPVIAVSIVASMKFYAKRNQINFRKSAFLVLILDIIVSLTPALYLMAHKNNYDLGMAAMVPMVMIFFSLIISFLTLVINFIIASRIPATVSENSLNLDTNSSSMVETEGNASKSIYLIIIYLIAISMSLAGKLLVLGNIITNRQNTLQVVAVASLFLALVYVVFANLPKKLYKTPISFIALLVFIEIVNTLIIFLLPVHLTASSRENFMEYLGLAQYFIFFVLAYYWNFKDLKYFKNQQVK